MLGEQHSADVVRHLDHDEIARIGREVARLSSISAEQAQSVLQEFLQMTVAQNYVVKGGMEYARKLLVSALDPVTATKILDRLAKSLSGGAADFDAIQKADPQQLAKFIHTEHPQTIALILSHLNPSQAAGLLFSLPADMRADIAIRMANLDQISPEIISKIAGVIGSKLKSLGEFSREAYGGVRAVSEMFTRLDSSTSNEILKDIERGDATLAETIRHLMFVFEDLLLLDQNAVKELVPKIDKKVLTIALKGTTEKLKTHLLAAMSQRGAEMLREDMEALGPVRIKDVEAAQQNIIALVRKLEAEGLISVHGTAGEQYVV